MKMIRRFQRHAPRMIKKIGRQSGLFFMLVMTLFYSFGGLDLYLGFTTPFTPKLAGAAYTGKHLKTVEYILGNGTEGLSQASNVTTYFGSATSTTKGSAGTEPVVLEGTNIAVKSAYLDVSYVLTAVIQTNENIFFDVTNSSSGGTDARVSEYIGASLWAQSGLSGYQRHQYDVTSFFDRQTDAMWSAGVPVVAGVQITGPARTLTTVKLVVTYESDYSLVSHTETKTVRFPLSAATTTRGTSGTVCAAAKTCTFFATSTIPDAVADGDILSVFVEVHAEVNSGTASNFRVGIRGGSGVNASSTQMNWGEALTDDPVVTAIWSPSVGSPNFQRNATMRFDILSGTVPMNAVGGELVVTYRYSTGAAVQTDTVRYFVDQDTTANGSAKTLFATVTPVISNGGLSMKNIWYKAHVAAVASTTFTMYGNIGTSTEVSTTIVMGSGATTNPRAGDDHTLIFDLSDQAGSFFNSATTIAGATKFSSSTAAAPVAIEAYFTFTWSGSLGGPQTQTVSFPGAQQGVDAIASDFNNRPTNIILPETVTKTYRSAYLETKYMHSLANNINIGTLTLGINGSTTVITEAADLASEAYASTYFAPIASSTFSNGDTINWTERVIEINETKSVANLASFANMVVVTYDAAQELKVPTFAQNYYLFYVDNNTLTPTDVWPPGAASIGENTEITAADTPLLNNGNIRLRMSVTVATTTMTASSTSFKLQYAPRVSTCGVISSWSDLGAPGSGAIMRGFNATPADGSNLPSVLLSASTRAGLYQESNNAVLNPFATAVGEDVEYDWNIQNNAAATDTIYCFRMAKADGTVFNNYSPSYPTLTTAGYGAEQKNWRWYNDETNETPVTALAAENTAPVDIVDNNILKLRVTLNEVNGSNGVNEKFRLQFSEYSDFSQGVTELASIANCIPGSLWCYGDGTDADDDAISTLVLTDSTAKGRHNEVATSTSTMDPVASTPTEFEYTIKQAGAPRNTTYYFRLWDNNHNRPVPLGGGETFPSLSTSGGIVTLSSGTLSSGVTTGGITTDISTTPTSVPFGTIPIGTSGLKAAQRFTITTDAAEGYSMFLQADAPLLSQYGTSVPDVVGTNASPLSWASACLSTASGCWGYHTTDASLSGGSTRFVLDDTYAQFSTTSPQEVLYNAGPVTNDVNDVIYRIEAHQTLPAGSYDTSIQYILVPIF